MEYVGDPEHPAPVLVNLPIEPDEAVLLYARVLRNVETFLLRHRVHADLSAYNMLLWEERLVIIDFPQAVDPRYNDDAFDLLLRDIENTNEWFQDTERKPISSYDSGLAEHCLPQCLGHARVHVSYSHANARELSDE